MGRMTSHLRAALSPELAGAPILRERHRRDSSSILVGRADAGGEAVALYQRGDGALYAWDYPGDPYLPALGELHRAGSPAALGPWARPWDAAGVRLLRRLMYNPGQRAAFLLDAPGHGGQLLLKLVRPALFDDILARQLRLEALGLADRLPAPRLVSYAPGAAAMLYSFIPGAALDMPGQASAGLADAVAGLLAGLHAIAAPGLPAWDMRAELGRTRAMLADLARWSPAQAAELELQLDEVAGRLASARSGGRLCHGDLTARNLIAVGPGRLALIDWDSAGSGPPERDLASAQTALHRLGADRQAFLTAYERRSGRQADRALIDALTRYQRLIKQARRAFRDDDPA